MDDRQTERAREAGSTAARRLADSAQNVADRAGAYMQSRMSHVSERAQDFAQRADTRVAELTGRPVESWAGDVRGYARDHPLAAIAVAVVLGYVVGKLMTRGVRGSHPRMM